MIKITVGDIEFQKTLTELEKAYIHAGQNWISKYGREISLKSLHLIGYTLDQVNALPEEEQEKVWADANRAWEDEMIASMVEG